MLILLIFQHVVNGTRKRKLYTWIITEKYKIPKKIDKGETFAAIPRKHGIPKQMSRRMNEKSKIYNRVAKNRTAEKRQTMRSAASKDLDKALVLLFWALLSFIIYY